jgi:hypothetical protein
VQRKVTKFAHPLGEARFANVPNFVTFGFSSVV